jgi:hypothetical protein
MSERFEDAHDETTRLVSVLQICSKTLGDSSESPEAIPQLEGFSFAISVMDRDRHAGVRERLGDGPAYASGCPGDQGNLDLRGNPIEPVAIRVEGGHNEKVTLPA